MPKRLHRQIQGYLHPDRAAGHREEQARMTKALQEFNALPVAFVDEDEKARRQKAKDDADRETAERMARGEAEHWKNYRKRRAAWEKGQETKRRNAEAKARESGTTGTQKQSA